MLVTRSANSFRGAISLKGPRLTKRVLLTFVRCVLACKWQALTCYLSMKAQPEIGIGLDFPWNQSVFEGENAALSLFFSTLFIKSVRGTEANLKKYGLCKYHL